MSFVELNPWAILVAAIVCMALGALWYSPALFGNQWMKWSGMTAAKMDESKKKGIWKFYLVAFIARLAMTIIFAALLGGLVISGWSDGVITAFWVWLGFFVPVQLGSVLWDDKPFSLFLLNTGYELLSLIIMGVILSLWL